MRKKMQIKNKKDVLKVKPMKQEVRFRKVFIKTKIILIN